MENSKQNTLRTAALVGNSTTEAAPKSPLLFGAVKRAIDALDPMGLLDIGAPSDEYDELARDVASLIHADMSPRQIARLMAKEFSEDFGEHFSSSQFLPAAEEITTALSKSTN